MVQMETSLRNAMNYIKNGTNDIQRMPPTQHQQRLTDTQTNTVLTPLGTANLESHLGYNSDESPHKRTRT